MKKDDSIYRLLSELPKIQEKKTVVREKTEPDDLTVLRDALKDVREINREKHRMKRKIDKPHCLSHGWPDMERQMREAVKDHRKFDVSNLPEYMEGRSLDVNPLTMEKLKNGEFSIQKVLDLHGHTADEAGVLFENFLREAIHAGCNCVKVIHGRGLKSKAGPVLKEKLKGWIVRAMHRKWVAAFSSCRMSEGGTGATYILLRRRPEKKKIHISG